MLRLASGAKLCKIRAREAFSTPFSSGSFNSKRESVATNRRTLRAASAVDTNTAAHAVIVSHNRQRDLDGLASLRTPQALEYLVARLPDVSGTQRNHHVFLLHIRQNRFDGLVD
ncbi:MAG: hypothetical protein M3R59_11835, partial [Verrucomicrobiota bacterium]|nr:hypothetical protein [Verrucomicrobiota bacterium]